MELNKLNNNVKIIGGHWKRKNIIFSDKDGLRPTLGRVRETLYNWLNQDLTDKSCLDLFSGSGALGFEALSRNASITYMIEKDNNIYKVLVANKDHLKTDKAVIINTTAENFISQNHVLFDIIFFDPPFQDKNQISLLPLLKQHLAPDGLIYFESDNKFEEEHFKIIKSSRAGKVYFYLLQ